MEQPTASKRDINFQDMPQGSSDVLNLELQNKILERFTADQPVSVPMEQSGTSNSYLNLVLSPNLRDLELMIRGLEYVKRTNPYTGRDEVVLKKVEDHPLNEYGIQKILEFLKIYTSPELKLGRKRPRDYYNSVQQVGRDIVRLVYKNLANFGMNNQIKQRNAKTFCLAIIEVADATFSRSIEGKENDLSRAEIKIEGTLDNLDNPAKYFTKQQKENLKN